MNKEINKCDWCQGETNMPNTFVAMSPIQPKMEKRIQEAINKYGNEWWIELEKNNKKLFEELSFYDQLVSTVGRGFVCAKCLDKDNVNWIKYRKNEKITE
tara:strand:+ start:146 stop:445 length:300 start_codon:yes stop_codon:yes gene_type:complete